MNNGDTLFVLGANGTGKSSLMQRLKSLNRENSRWISAHRQSWFESDLINLTPQNKRELDQNYFHHDLNIVSRCRDWNAGNRVNLAIYELVEAENLDNRALAKAVRVQDDQLVEILRKKEPPIAIISRLLQSSNLPIHLFLHQDEQVMASKSGSEPFSVAYLSDGERNALLIAATVLTAKPGALILIDEPERHLHRSIISPLLTRLFALRKDCVFIVSTHDILLPFNNPKARTLLVRSCKYSEGGAVEWDADLVLSNVQIDEGLKLDILGARRRILFVEGTENSRSLDQPLYSLVFPEVSVIAKSNCNEVRHAVAGTRAAVDLHWLKAFGIVDSDGHDSADIEQLKQRGIYAVPAYSVEALYYHPEIQRRVAERHATVTGQSAEMLLTNAKTAALQALSQHADRMSRKVAEKAIRAKVIQQIPGKVEIGAGQTIEIRIDTAAEVLAERTRFDARFVANDLDHLIQRYPVRETPALFEIARALGFQDREQYQSAVLKLLMDDASALTYIRSLFGTLWDEMILP